ncbi:MAG: asparagine synthetase B family protein [Candidatus Acidiferrales bacterium]
MSGIVGIFRRDGGPADQSMARALTRSLAFRGPDAQQIWCSGPVALGHAMLRATEESAFERQPAAVGGKMWITADARLDARGDLLEALAQAGQDARKTAPDCELILEAYAAWGDECVQRLRGDFAFGIWDAPRQMLFCARDHVGIKQFYFAESKDFFLFSNTLDCVRTHPDVPDDLNEAAIADFLLFGLNCDPATTTFRAIRRLPPGHFLRVSTGELRIKRYWTFPVDGHIRYNHSDQYVEHFQIHLRDAVADRLKGARVGILLSGGLDSSSLAATARGLSPERGESGKLRAYTATHEETLKEQDGAHARELAGFLGIPIRCLPMDRLQPFERWENPTMHWPEPVDDPLMAGLFDQFTAIAAECRAAFNGEGADNLMDFQMLPYARSLVRNREWRRLRTDVPRFLRVRQVPWRGAHEKIKHALGAGSDAVAFPKWLDPDFARRVDAKARWREGCAPRVAPKHAVKPRAHASMYLPHWTLLFEMLDAGVTGRAVDVRYPFLDLRIIDYLLAIPSFPWAFKKTILREAMAGYLPEKIRLRPKTPLPDEPMSTALGEQVLPRIAGMKWSEELERFVRRAAYRSPHSGRAVPVNNLAMRPLCLNFWLQRSSSLRYNLMAEVGNG